MLPGTLITFPPGLHAKNLGVILDDNLSLSKLILLSGPLSSNSVPSPKSVISYHCLISSVHSCHPGWITVTLSALESVHGLTTTHISEHHETPQILPLWHVGCLPSAEGKVGDRFASRLWNSLLESIRPAVDAFKRHLKYISIVWILIVFKTVES